MGLYTELIERYLYEQFPMTTTNQANQFEAISAAVIGTKQRRNGPLPSPEIQVDVRNVLRTSLETGGPIHFFLPWAGSKLDDGRGIDVIEQSSLKQLRCLSDELARYKVETRFHFRLDDLTDQVLFPRTAARLRQIDNYVSAMKKLGELTLPNAVFGLESECVCYELFRQKVDALFPDFREYLKYRQPVALVKLQSHGWTGAVPVEQQRHYYDAYAAMGIPSEEHANKLATYFAVALTRAKSGATRRPTEPHITLSFDQHVPGTPPRGARLHYRSIPERYTNQHRAPWNARGYLRVEENGEVSPRILTADVSRDRVVPYTTTWNGLSINLDYLPAGDDLKEFPVWVPNVRN